MESKNDKFSISSDFINIGLAYHRLLTLNSLLMSMFVILKAASRGWGTTHRVAINKPCSESCSSPERADRCFIAIQSQTAEEVRCITSTALCERGGVWVCVPVSTHTCVHMHNPFTHALKVLARRAFCSK